MAAVKKCLLCDEYQQPKLLRAGAAPGYWHVSFARASNWTPCRKSEAAMKWENRYYK